MFKRLVVMKACFLLFDLATLAVVVGLLRLVGQHVGWSIVYAWCPLVIVEFAGEPIDDWNELPRVVAETTVDDKVAVVVLRDGKRKTFKARIWTLEEPEVQTASVTREGGVEEFGLRVQQVTPDIAEQLGMDAAEGVVITAIDSGSPASEAGLRRGDVILEVNRTEVANVDALKQRLDDAGQSALLLIRRGEATIFVPVKRSKG